MQRLQPLQRGRDQSGLRAGRAGILSPPHAVLARQPAHQAAQLVLGDGNSRVGTGPLGQLGGDQQRDVPIRPQLRHAQIREVVVGIDHGDPFRAHLRHQAGQLGDPPHDRAALRAQIGRFLRDEPVVVEHGVFEEPTGEPMAEGAVAQLVRLRHGLLGELLNSLGKQLGGDRGRTARRGQQPRERAPLDVVERVAGIAHERLLVTRDACENPERQEQPNDRHEIRALLASLEPEGHPRAREVRVSRGEDHALGQPTECDLGVRAFEHGERQAGEDVPAASERHAGSRIARRMRHRGRGGQDLH